MNDNLNLMLALREEWDALADSALYRDALRRWKETEPDLAVFDSPGELLLWCRDQADPREANRLVGAVLRVAADTVAARTLLQLIIPGLTARIGRALGREAACRRVAGVREELVQEVVVAAWERIAALAGTSPRWPACELVEGAWRRVRHQREKGRACERRLWPLESAREAAEPEWTRTTAEELTVCLIDAVRDGRLRPGQAGVVYTTRVLGVPPRALAGRCGPDERAVRARRARAERILTDGAGGSTVASPG
jgi:DNA-directed RNA polymerase specialized sigma24 family protein